MVFQAPVIVTLIWCLSFAAGGYPDEARLLDDLLSGYNTAVRPSDEPHGVVVIAVKISLIHLNDLDTEGQNLDTLIRLDMEWRDPSLRWAQQDYAGVEIISVPGDMIWSPDITIANLVKPLEHTSPNRKVLHFDGKVFWSRASRVVSYCVCDPASSEHMCQLKLNSWSYNGSQLDLRKTGNEENVDLSNYVYNRKWAITSTNATRNVIHYASCPEPYVDIRFGFNFRSRQT